MAGSPAPASIRLAGGGLNHGRSASRALFTPVVEIVGKAERERFRQPALAAVDKLLEGKR